MIEALAERCAAEERKKIEAAISVLPEQIASKANEQLEVITRLDRLAVGEVFYMSYLPLESPEEAKGRLYGPLMVEQRHKSLNLLLKFFDDRVRIRRMPDYSAKGSRAEWHNLLPGQSDTIVEDLDEEALDREYRKARRISDEIKKQGKGWVEVEKGVRCIRIFRSVAAGQTAGSYPDFAFCWPTRAL